MAAAVHVRERVDFHRDSYSYLIKGLNRQRKSGEFCDVTLTVNGRSFCAHKAVLAATSPYFRSMFTSRMKEQTSGQVDLSESFIIDKCDSFKQILEFLYTGDIKITTDNAEDILRIADFLLLDDVKDYCRQFFLWHGNLDLSNCLYVGSLAEQHHVPEVATVASRIIKARFHDYFILSEEIVELPYELLAELLRSPDVTLFSAADNLLKGILRWVKYHYSERFVYLSQLCACVQFTQNCAYAMNALLDKNAMISSWEIEQKCESFWGSDGAWCRQVQCGNTAVSGGGVESVLIAVSCNSSLRHLKMLVYRTAADRWYSLTTHCDAIVQTIPSRLGISAATLCGNTLYLFLSYSLPYPSDMLRIHVVAFNVETKEHYQLTFRHQHNTSEACQTTLTDDRSIPPAMVVCGGQLCIVGNVDGAGHLFVCDVSSQTYVCHQIPATRFISLCRVVVKDDAFIYIWSRHRFGHEEYCINKEVGFDVFNMKLREFMPAAVPPPPGIDYTQFADVHVLSLERDSLVVHTPGKASLIFDESRMQWLTHSKRLPALPRDTLPDTPYSGCQLYTAVDEQLFVLENPAAYTTGLHRLSEPASCLALTPPPTDGLSVLVAGQLPTVLLEAAQPCRKFDDTYTKLVHHRISFAHDVEPEEIGYADSVLSDSVHDEYELDDFEYDEEIYGYYEEYEY